MIKHFCDICEHEIEDKRIKIHVTGGEKWGGDGYFERIGDEVLELLNDKNKQRRIGKNKPYFYNKSCILLEVIL